MGIEENKEVVRRIFEANNEREFDTLWEFYTSDYIGHYSDGYMSLEQTKQMAALLISAFPDWNGTVEDLVAEGNKVAVRFTYRGTHKGEFRGITPTGNSVEFTNDGIFRIENGKLVELWVTMDRFGLMQQLGVLPTN